MKLSKKDIRALATSRWVNKNRVTLIASIVFLFGLFIPADYLVAKYHYDWFVLGAYLVIVIAVVMLGIKSQNKKIKELLEEWRKEQNSGDK